MSKFNDEVRKLNLCSYVLAGIAIFSVIVTLINFGLIIMAQSVFYTVSLINPAPLFAKSIRTYEFARFGFVISMIVLLVVLVWFYILRKRIQKMLSDHNLLLGAKEALELHLLRQEVKTAIDIKVDKVYQNSVYLTSMETDKKEAKYWIVTQKQAENGDLKLEVKRD